MQGLANSYSYLGRHDEALEMGEKTLEFRRRVLPENHPNIGEGDGVYGRWCIAFHRDILCDVQAMP